MKILAIDFGTSFAKWGIFEDGKLLKKQKGNTPSEMNLIIKEESPAKIICSSVSMSYQEIAEQLNTSIPLHFLTYQSKLNFTLKYKSPETLGTDRIAAVAGARELFPENDCLIIDAGTCITYEFINASGEYLGGAISPGMEIKFKALQQFTKRLPLVEREEGTELIGNTTQNAIKSGVIHGTIAEIREIIRMYRNKSPNLRLVICGGDSTFFANHIEDTIKIAPDLVLIGLYAIQKYND